MLPRSAVALGQVMFTVTSGVKVLMTVGIISAFWSLGDWVSRFDWESESGERTRRECLFCRLS